MWSAEQSALYHAEEIKRLVAEGRVGNCALAPVGNLKTAGWRLAVDVPVATTSVETRIAAIERSPSAGRGQAAQFVPMRFAWPNKLGRHEKLLLAFDALALSAMLGRDVTVGKIIQGDDHAVLKVKLPALVSDARKLLKKAAALLSNPSPPDLVLNRHCAECEFQARCQQKAIEKDDLSLFAGMTEKERKKYHNKGIFTVTQLGEKHIRAPAQLLRVAAQLPSRLRQRRQIQHGSSAPAEEPETFRPAIGCPALPPGPRRVVVVVGFNRHALRSHCPSRIPGARLHLRRHRAHG